jgi:predicted MPP superfamily phosphohydrolase
MATPPERQGASAGGGRISRLRRARRHRMIAVVALAQVPAVLALAALTGGWGALVALPALALTVSFLSAYPGPWAIVPRGRVHLYAGLWPFFAWWVAAACFAILAAAIAPFATLFALPWRPVAIAALAIAGVLGVGAVWRRPRVVRVELAFPDLPAAFDGYRIAQLSDVHCGPFAPEARVASWCRRASGLGADLVAVTGDLIASGPSHVEAVARALGGLRAPDGVVACMGNHDYFGAGEPLVRALEHHGLHVLRNRTEVVRRGEAALAIAGVDDTWTGRAELARAIDGRPADAFPILLAHDPDLFPEAARLGVRLTLSGHTHGGQVGVPFLARRWNMARLVTRFTAGLYRLGPSALYVNRGVGTSGPPIRVGVAAEITLFTLHSG